MVRPFFRPKEKSCHPWSVTRTMQIRLCVNDAYRIESLGFFSVHRLGVCFFFKGNPMGFWWNSFGSMRDVWDSSIYFWWEDGGGVLGSCTLLSNLKSLRFQAIREVKLAFFVKQRLLVKVCKRTPKHVYSVEFEFLQFFASRVSRKQWKLLDQSCDLRSRVAREKKEAKLLEEAPPLWLSGCEWGTLNLVFSHGEVTTHWKTQQF